MDIQIEELIGQTGNLYWCSDQNCFQLGTVLFEVLEDENDGYRSSMDKLRILRQDTKMTQLLGEIKIMDISDSSNTMYALQDGDGFNWVEFGTENIDDYYPGFIFRTMVKEDKEKKQQEERQNHLKEVFEKLKK